jgi:ABC-type phosphate/phosphonate transport system substrate-binding protein
MNWVTTLPMYNVTPTLARDWRTFLTHVHTRLRPWLAARGDTWTIMDSEAAILQDLWLRPDLLLSQTCGYPLVTTLAGRVQLIATPSFKETAGNPGDYHSIVVTSHPEIDTLAQSRGRRAAYNSNDSNSGMNLLRHAVAPLANRQAFFASVHETGSHLASLRALTSQDKADIAAIDCVTFAFAREHLPHLAAGVREIGVTNSAPGLPLIASKHLPPDGVAALTAALSDAIDDHRPLANRLRLERFVQRPLADYASILQMESEAIALGYPRLA